MVATTDELKKKVALLNTAQQSNMYTIGIIIFAVMNGERLVGGLVEVATLESNLESVNRLRGPNSAGKKKFNINCKANGGYISLLAFLIAGSVTGVVEATVTVRPNNGFNRLQRARLQGTGKSNMPSK